MWKEYSKCVFIAYSEQPLCSEQWKRKRWGDCTHAAPPEKNSHNLRTDLTNLCWPGNSEPLITTADHEEPWVTRPLSFTSFLESQPGRWESTPESSHIFMPLDLWVAPVRSMCSREGSQTRLVFLPLLIIHGYVSLLLAVGRGKLEQPEISISRARDETAEISCKVFVESFQSVAIHWYRQKPNQGLEFLLYVLATPTETFLNKKYKKMKASKNSSASTSILTIYSLEEEDEAFYYCSYG